MRETGSKIGTIARETAKAVRRDLVLYLAIAIYVAWGVAHISSRGDLNPNLFTMYLRIWVSNFLLLYPVLYLLFGVLRIVHRFDRRRKLAFRRMFSPARSARFVAGTLLIMALMPFQAIFTTVKTTLSANGFGYDLAQANIDRAIHFGVDPWQLLYALSDSQWLLSVVEINYGVIWFGVWSAVLYWFAVSPKAEDARLRYILCFMLVWIVVGNALAGAFMSAGPAFFGEVTGDFDRFTEQLALLARNDGQTSSVVEYQRYLWSQYMSGNTGVGTGISAFPSVHVGLTMITALFVNEFSRRWGIAAFVYTGVIQLSSVYLAWHYAIDGYAAIVAALGIYFGMKYLPEMLSQLWSKRSSDYAAGPAIRG